MTTKKSKPTIGYVMGFMGISGGNKIIYEHANRLTDKGIQVYLLHLNDGKDHGWFEINPKVKIMKFQNKEAWIDEIDIVVATFNETLWDIIDLPHHIKKAYFVQSDERIFYEKGSLGEHLSSSTYSFENVHYFTSAKWMSQWLKREYQVEAPVFMNKIEEKQFYPDPDPDLKSDKKIVLVDGDALAPLKGVKDAVVALKDLDCEKWLITSTPTSALPHHARIFDRIFSQPAQEYIRKIYSSADIFVKPSYFESVSLPNMEAMACGCAVISTRSPGPNEYSVHLENSYMIDAKSPKQIKEAVKILLSDDKLRQKLREQGLAFAKKFFYNWDEEIEKLANFFQDIHEKVAEKPYSTTTNTRKGLENSFFHKRQNLRNRLYNRLRVVKAPFRRVKKFINKNY